MGESSDDRTKVERASDREMVVTRTFDAPPHIVFEAWTRPELFVRWWAPKSFGVPILSCEIDARTGGSYRLVFGHDEANSTAFFGNYVEVIPNARLVWTNDEGEDGQLTTVTFEARGKQTLLVMRELYPNKEALDEVFDGMGGSNAEQFGQLDELLATLGASA